MNRSILALCLWLILGLVVLVAVTDTETICIAAQSIDIDGVHLIDATECFEVTP